MGCVVLKMIVRRGAKIDFFLVILANNLKTGKVQRLENFANSNLYFN